MEEFYLVFGSLGFRVGGCGKGRRTWKAIVVITDDDQMEDEDDDCDDHHPTNTTMM